MIGNINYYSTGLIFVNVKGEQLVLQPVMCSVNV